jgi:hypothetical protein
VSGQLIRNIVAIFILNIEVPFIIFQDLFNWTVNALFTNIYITCHITFFIFFRFFIFIYLIVTLLIFILLRFIEYQIFFVYWCSLQFCMLLHKFYVFYLGDFVFFVTQFMSVVWNLRYVFFVDLIRVWLWTLLVISFFVLWRLFFSIIIMLFIPILEVRKPWLIRIVTGTLIAILIFFYIILIVIVIEIWAVNRKNMAAHLWVINFNFII